MLAGDDGAERQPAADPLVGRAFGSCQSATPPRVRKCHRRSAPARSPLHRRLHDGHDVVELALERVVVRIAAPPAAATVDSEDCEALLQRRGHRRPAAGSAAAPWISMSGGPSPVRQAAIDVPSLDTTSAGPAVTRTSSVVKESLRPSLSAFTALARQSHESHISPITGQQRSARVICLGSSQWSHSCPPAHAVHAARCRGGAPALRVERASRSGVRDACLGRPERPSRWRGPSCLLGHRSRSASHVRDLFFSG